MSVVGPVAAQRLWLWLPASIVIVVAVLPWDDDPRRFPDRYTQRERTLGSTLQLGCRCFADAHGLPIDRSRSGRPSAQSRSFISGAQAFSPRIVEGLERDGGRQRLPFAASQGYDAALLDGGGDIAEGQGPSECVSSV